MDQPIEGFKSTLSTPTPKDSPRTQRRRRAILFALLTLGVAATTTGYWVYWKQARCTRGGHQRQPKGQRDAHFSLHAHQPSNSISRLQTQLRATAASNWAKAPKVSFITANCACAWSSRCSAWMLMLSVAQG